jgi:signal transduction histidine kinase
MTADAVVLGTLNLGNLKELSYPKEAVNIVSFIAKQLGVAFERQKMQKTLEKLNKELNDKTFELRKNIITMGDANLKLFEAQKELREKDKKMKKLLTEVQEKNGELNTTLAELKQTQTQLVQSEKMASLGQLVTGIAHELNTPAGAIKAASEIIPEYIQKTLILYEELIEAGITPEHRKLLQDLIGMMVTLAKERERKTTAEIREQSKLVEQQLAGHGIEDIRFIAKDIARCYLENQLEALLELFEHYPSNVVMDFLNYCSRVLLSSRDNQISVGTISKIVRALKSYSYLDQSQERKVDLNEALENTLTILHSQIPPNVTIVKKFGILPKISCLGSELNQVWTNILQNALQVLEETGGTITIETSTTSRNVIVNIRDDGPGIPREIQDKIFDPFFTTKRGKASGLGLSITHQVIEKHQGTIQMNSVPGNTTFEVSLPKEGIDFKS